MILGSDRRPKNNVEGGSGARSDTIMLVRLNPDKDATAIMSLPRDLKVQIPGHGTDKINAAYELGGPRLTLRTVKQLTGLSINHVINVSFGGFWRAVNAIGCVYADIDRRYFNDNPRVRPDRRAAGLPAPLRPQGAPVRALPPRGQRPRALGPPAGLPAPDQAAGQLHGPDPEARPAGAGSSAATPPPTSGLRSRAEVLRLLKLAVFSAGRPIREVHFEGLIGPSYVEASDERVKKLVQEFLARGGHARARAAS